MKCNKCKDNRGYYYLYNFNVPYKVYCCKEYRTWIPFNIK